jgi:integrase
MIGQFRVGRRIMGGAWGHYREHWYRADEFGWLPARPGVHLLCCDAWESHAIPRLTLFFLAVITALRALVCPADAAALLRAAEGLPRAEHTADFIRIGLYVGMRPGEILGLEWRRVDLSRNLIYFGADNQKSGKVGSVPLNERAREAIIARARFRATWCPASPWVFCDREGERIASVKKSFASARDAAGLVDLHPHDLRRTCGAWLAMAGVSIKDIAAILRHSDIRVTDRVYTPIAPESLRGALGALDGALVSRSGFTLSPELLEIAAK